MNAKKGPDRKQQLLLEAQRLGRTGYIISDLARGRVYWSDSLFELRKVPRREFFSVAETMEFIHPEDRAAYLAARGAAVAERRDFETQVRVRHGDGSEAWEHTIGHPQYDDSGKLTGVLVVLRDITESRRTEAALRAKSDRISRLFNALPAIVWVYDADSRELLSVSDHALKVSGFSREELIGNTAGGLMMPDMRRRAESWWPRLMQEGHIDNFEFDLLRKDGMSVPMMYSAIVDADPVTGERIVVIVALDMSERQRAEVQLRAIMDNAPIAIFLKDLQGRYLSVNRRLEEWSGWTKDEARGRPATGLSSDRWIELAASSDETVMKTGDVVVFDTPTFAERPDYRHVTVTKFPVRDAAGTIVAIGGIIANDTQGKEAELALRQSQELLVESQRLGKVGYILVSTASGRAYWSDSMFDLRRVARREFFTFEEGMAFIHPEDRQRYLEVRAAAVAGRHDFVIDVRVVRGDGSIGWEYSVGHPRFDADGAPTGMLVVVRDLTERREAEQAVEESRAKFAGAFYSSADAMVVGTVGPELGSGIILDVNTAATQLFGLTRDELVGRSIAKSGIVVDLDELRTPRQRGLAGIPVENMPVRMRHKSQRIIETLISGSMFRVDEKSYSIIVVRDVTEARAAERKILELNESLAASLGQLRAITDNLPVAITYTDRDRLVRFLNLTTERWLGLSAAEVIGQDFRDLVRIEHGQTLEDPISAVLSGRPMRVERTLTYPDGKSRDLEILYVPDPGADGAVRGYYALAIDISERKQAEAAVRRSEARFRALIEHSDDVITIYQPDGTLTYRSPSRAASDLGYSEEDVIGKPFFDRVHPDEAARAVAGLAQLCKTPDGRASGRRRMRHKNGSFRYLDWTARNAIGVPGIDGVIVISRDVTEAVVLQEELQQAQKMEAIGQLAGGIAHDFNNLLGAVLGFAGFLLQDLPRGSPQHSFAQRIVTASERGKELVEQILTFSRTGGVERKPTDLARIVRETRDLLRASLPSSTKLEVLGEAEGLVAQVNPAQIGQILLNLCLNANHALQGKRGSISITLSRAPPGAAAAAVALAEAGENGIVDGTLHADRAYARIAVADTGIGMDEGVLRQIFNPFFTTKARGQGTGLGLAVVHGVVKAYGGACIVTSQPGAGSVFAIYLPLASDSVGAATTEAPLPDPRGRERVLIVDDDGDIRDVLSIGLDRLGYEVAALDDPEAALAVFVEHPDAWDVVISDQIMPTMTGVTLLERLKTLRPGLRFVLCSGDGGGEAAALAAGASAFFVKPVSPEEIAQAIRRLIDAPSAAVDAPSPPR
jgi:PAS domain S-box-containing protein